VKVWTSSDRASSPIWVMCRGVICLKLLADETEAMTKTVPHPGPRSPDAALFGQEGELVIHGTFTIN